jgi:hypothetical protein
MSKHTPGPWQVDENAKGYDTDVAKCIVWGPKGPGYGAIAYTSPHGLPYSDGLQIADVAKCIVWGPKGPGYGAIAYTSPHEIPYSDGLQIADARLIAAAPELLAACKEMLSEMMVWEDAHGIHPAATLARAAIAKAEGVPTVKEADRHG